MSLFTTAEFCIAAIQDQFKRFLPVLTMLYNNNNITLVKHAIIGNPVCSGRTFML